MDDKKVSLLDTEYMPDLMHRDAVSFLNAHKDKPFFLYYSMSHVHGQILPTPDSAKPDTGTDGGARYNQLYSDNINYMDKLVGTLLSELDRRVLRFVRGGTTIHDDLLLSPVIPTIEDDESGRL